MKKNITPFTKTYCCPIKGMSVIEGFTERIYSENEINPVKTNEIIKECSNWSSDCIGHCPKCV